MNADPESCVKLETKTIGNRTLGVSRSGAWREHQRFFIGCGVLLLVGALRIPWLWADGGNAGMWTYGFFLTDEGAYTSGGRLAHLTGKFLDPEMSEPTVFGYAWGMSFLSYLSYQLIGLSWIAARLPTVCAAMAAWTLVYVLASRRTKPWLAGLLTAILSSNPISLTFERVASTDVVLGSLAVAGYWMLLQRPVWPAALAGAFLALATSVKTNAVGLLPLLVLAAFLQRDRKWQRVIWFAAGLCVGWFLLVTARDACLRAAIPPGSAWTAQELSRDQLMGLTEFQPDVWLRALSIFPRWPVSNQLGPLLPWLLLLAPWYLITCRRRTGRWITPRSLPCVGMLIYLGMLAIQARCTLRYFIPLLYFAPLLLITARGADSGRNIPLSRRTKLVTLGCSLGLVGLHWMPVSFPVESLRLFFSSEYVLPQKAIWASSWPLWISAWLAAAAVIRVSLITPSVQPRWLLSLVIMSIALTSVIFANQSVSITARTGATPFSDVLRDQALLQAATLGLIFLLAAGRSMHRWKTWYFCMVCAFGAFGCLNTHWLAAYREIPEDRRLLLTASRQLGEALPPNSMVIGRYASTLLRNTPLRVGFTSPNYEPDEFVSRVGSLLRNHPDRPLNCLVETTWNPRLRDFLLEDSATLDTRLIMILTIRGEDPPDIAPLGLFEISPRTPRAGNEEAGPDLSLPGKKPSFPGPAHQPATQPSP